MSSWLISVPIWGGAYLRMFECVGAPALLAAARSLRNSIPLQDAIRVVVHTDRDINRIRAALRGLPVEARKVPPKTTYIVLQESHQDALASAAPGERVVFLNADLTISGNLLTRCAEHFAAGKRAIVLLGIRTEAGQDVPPAGASPRDLLFWAWVHRHRIIRDLEWGTGRSMLPTNIFWSAGGSVVARGFHLHPVAVIKGENVGFNSTIDGDLLDHFPRECIHVVTGADDCALCETSVPERRFPVGPGSMTVNGVAASMRTRASATHRWLFDHRIIVCGDGAENGDIAIAADIQRAMGDVTSTSFGAAAAPRRPMRGPGSYPIRGRPRRA